jgi:deoxyribodipyrimidine photo-lyase
MQPQILWFRQDLRLADQPALRAAAAAGPVIPVYILDDEAPAAWRRGAASRWWLHHSLTSLAKDLAARGAPLILRRGDSVETLLQIAGETGAGAIHALGHFEPWARRQEQALAETGLLHLHGSIALAPLHQLRTGSGGAFKVFSPFWRALQHTMPPPLPLPAPGKLEKASHTPASDRLDDWQLLPTRPNWARGFDAHWQPGEAGATARLKVFAPKAGDYAEARNMVADIGTSMLSPHLHFGELSAAQAWHSTQGGAESWLRQLGWRDFSFNLLMMSPDLADVNWRRDFDGFPWVRHDASFDRWCRGETGFPIVDAGMRQLWQTGWMHNRVRMITASFLIKDLLIHWREGERWFWDTLVDADLGNNAAGWQWTAGSGADAAPYFRIFNPVSQGEKFDPAGDYVRRHVPELAHMPTEFIHKPWMAPALVLKEAGVALGTSYPQPMVDHALARDKALGAYKHMKDAA